MVKVLTAQSPYVFHEGLEAFETPEAATRIAGADVEYSIEFAPKAKEIRHAFREYENKIYVETGIPAYAHDKWGRETLIATGTSDVEQLQTVKRMFEDAMRMMTLDPFDTDFPRQVLDQISKKWQILLDKATPLTVDVQPTRWTHGDDHVIGVHFPEKE